MFVSSKIGLDSFSEVKSSPGVNILLVTHNNLKMSLWLVEILLTATLQAAGRVSVS